MKIEKYVRATLYKMNELSESHTPNLIDTAHVISENDIFCKMENTGGYINIAKIHTKEELFNIRVKLSMGKSLEDIIVFPKKDKVLNNCYFIGKLKNISSSELTAKQCNDISKFEKLMGYEQLEKELVPLR